MTAVSLDGAVSAGSAPARVIPPRRGARAILVLIVEDQPLLAEMLADVLAAEPDIRVVGVAGTVAAAVSAASLHPDVVLMDYRLPDGTGADATRGIKARWATARVIIVSAIHDDHTIMDSIQAGADGYLTKDQAVGDIIGAIRAARAGETLLPRSVISAIAGRMALGEERRTDQRRVEPLTPRQLEILRCIAGGLSTREICDKLSVSPNTLRTHVDRILRKFGVHSKLQAVTFALRTGLIESPRDGEPPY
jgi:DNA-binding NarL/FixJ family response regulator